MVSWSWRSALVAVIVALVLAALIGAGLSGSMRVVGPNGRVDEISGSDPANLWQNEPSGWGWARAAPEDSWPIDTYPRSEDSLSYLMGVPACSEAPPCVPVGDSVKPVQPAAVAPDPYRPDLAGEYAETDVSGLRLRSDPSTSAPILGLLYEGDTLYVRSDFGEGSTYADWIGVVVEDSVTGLRYTSGYVYRDYVR